MNIALDALDNKAASVYDGYLVRKDLVRRYSRQYPVPTYVVEFLLGRYCASTDEQEIAEGLEIVEKQLKDRTVRTGDQEIFKARARDTGPVKLIDLMKARLDTRNDRYDADLPSLGLKDVRIADNLVREHERMLTDAFYAEVTLSYDAIIAQQQGGRPFAIDAIRPIQMSKSDVLDVYEHGRRSFTTEEWVHLLLRSIGLEPATFSERAKRVALLRMPSVLLWVPRFDPFDLNPESQPPHGELAQPVEGMRRRKRDAVVRPDHLREAELFEGALEDREGERLLGGQQSPRTSAGSDWRSR